MKKNFLFCLMCVMIVFWLFSFSGCTGTGGIGESDSTSENQSVEESKESVVDFDDLEPTDERFFKFYQNEDETYTVIMDDETLHECPSEIVFPSAYNGKDVVAFEPRTYYYNGVYSQVTKVFVPKTIQRLDCIRLAFPNLEEVVVAEDNEWIKVLQGCLINNDGVLIAGLKGAKIPNNGSVTEIGMGAFIMCRDLKDVVIPDSVTKICGAAFAATSIEKIVIGKNVTECEIPFAEVMPNLRTIEVSFENEKFYSVNNCLIERATKTIVLGCNTSVIPGDGSVERIGANAFYAALGYDGEVDWDEFIEEGMRGLPLRESEPTDFVIPEGVKYIGDKAFSLCNIGKLTIPSTIEEIDDYAFAHSDIIEVYYNGDVSSWNKLDLNSRVWEGSKGSSPLLRSRFFIKDVEVTEIVFPKGTEKITESFAYCESLKKVTIPDSVTEIVHGAFTGCGLETIVYEGTKEEWGLIKGSGNYEEKVEIIYNDKAHNYVVVSETLPTCTDKGETLKRCTDCGKEIAIPVSALGHDYQEIIITYDKATCEADYYIADRCVRCDYLDSDNIRLHEKDSHRSSNWDVTTVPTFESEGEISGVCEQCEKQVTVTIPALNSEDYIFDNGNYDCSVAKSVEVRYCKMNNVTFNIDVPAQNHVVRLTSGVYEITDDTVLNITKEDVESEYIDFYEPSCKEPFMAHARCANEMCSEIVYVTVLYPEHVEIQSNVTATCTDGGTADIVCASCGIYIRTENIPALGHEYEYYLSDDEYKIVANCVYGDNTYDIEIEKTEEYLPRRYCEPKEKGFYGTNRDGEEVVVWIEIEEAVHVLYGKLAPRFDENGNEIIFTVDNYKVFANEGSAACGNYAFGYFVCEVCDSTVYVRVKSEHVLSGEEQIIVEPKCETDGEAEFVCSVCGEKIKRIIPALGHDFIEVTIIEEGNEICETEYFTANRCQRCADVDTDSITQHEKAPHEYENGVCIRCGAEETSA